MNFQRSEHILLKNVQTYEHFWPESVQSCEQIVVEMRMIGKNRTIPIPQTLSLG